MSESSPPSRNLTTEEILTSNVTAENTVTHTTEHDALQAAALSEPQDQDYECYECFGMFEDDIALGNQAEWAMCACGKWLHEDCVSETVVDANGRLRMCSSCVV